MALVHFSDDGLSTLCAPAEEIPDHTRLDAEVTCANCITSLAAQVRERLTGLPPALRAVYQLHWVTQATVVEHFLPAAVLAFLKLPDYAVRNGKYLRGVIVTLAGKLSARSIAPGASWCTYGDLWHHYGVKRGWLDDCVRTKLVSVINETIDGEPRYSWADIDHELMVEKARKALVQR